MGTRSQEIKRFWTMAHIFKPWSWLQFWNDCRSGMSWSTIMILKERKYLLFMRYGIGHNFFSVVQSCFNDAWSVQLDSKLSSAEKFRNCTDAHRVPPSPFQSMQIHCFYRWQGRRFGMIIIINCYSVHIVVKNVLSANSSKEFWWCSMTFGVKMELSQILFLFPGRHHWDERQEKNFPCLWTLNISQFLRHFSLLDHRRWSRQVSCFPIYLSLVSCKKVWEFLKISLQASRNESRQFHWKAWSTLRVHFFLLS